MKTAVMNNRFVYSQHAEEIRAIESIDRDFHDMNCCRIFV